MKKLLLLCFIVGIHLTTFAQPTQEADQLLNALVEEKNIVGVTAGYAVEGEILWKNSSGFRCLASKSPFTENTLTRTASIAKPMTAVALMQLVEQGKIQLDSPLNTYLPKFPKKEKGIITIRQLLAHTSGISQYHSVKEVENTQNFSTLQTAMEVFWDRPLLFEPGTKFFYTTYGYVILGRVIEEVSGMPYADYMQKNIFDKAGMSNTGVEQVGKSYENKACLYHKNKKKPKLAPQNDLSNRVPGGGFHTTMQDLINFGQALLDNTLIQESSLAEMQISPFKAKEGNPYGLGWFFYGPPPYENLVIGHSGEQTGAATQLMLIPKSKTVVVVLANTSGTWKDVVSFSSELIRISEQHTKH